MHGFQNFDVVDSNNGASRSLLACPDTPESDGNVAPMTQTISQSYRPLRTGGIHHGTHVIHAFLQRGGGGYPAT
jgi:hypothetical protein